MTVNRSTRATMISLIYGQDYKGTYKANSRQKNQYRSHREQPEINIGFGLKSRTNWKNFVPPWEGPCAVLLKILEDKTPKCLAQHDQVLAIQHNEASCRRNEEPRLSSSGSG